MVRTLIIEDNAKIRTDLSLFMTRQENFILIGECGTVAEGKVLIENTKPDLLLLDIELPDGNGFDLLSGNLLRNFKVIFITSFESYAIKAIKFGAFDYILKPIEEEDFKLALQRISEQPLIEHQQTEITKEYLHGTGVQKRIILRYNHFLHFIPFAEIIYCRGEGPYTTFYLTDNRKPMLTHPIVEYENVLPNNLFVRTHKSYLVNVQYVERIHSDGYLMLKDGTEIPVSSRRKKFVENILMKDD